MFRSVDDDTRYVMVESWASQENLDAHGKSPAMAEMAKIGPFLAGAPVMHTYED
ncbi:MAG: antibiotic biosynthesis monooxygenase [Myxococcota bacterium]